MPLQYAARALALSLLAAATVGCSETVVEARLDGQPLVYLKDGIVDGCGVRVIVVELPSNRSAPITAYDASFNIKAPGRGIITAQTADATLADFESGKPERRKAIPPESFWFKALGGKATAPDDRTAGKMLAGDEAGSVVYLSDVGPVMALFTSQAARKPIQMGVKRPGAAAEKIFSGTIEMSDGDRARIAACVAELSRRT